ncbi:MAG: acyl-ACP--UDP-N-acetylglucosamine O-acyltransferase [Rhodobacteraceae bacterium]|nr:acyl-ACP--UDP-N-acetylglucosamine O-acyltransferase [Paracoccaceae bacterium]
MSIDPSAVIHRTAEVSKGAVVGPEVQIGPFCVIGSEVTLGRGVVVKSHAVISGWTGVGAETIIFPFACVGEIPQDLKFRGERTRLVIGERNRIREGATLNCGTELGGGVTTVGDDCLFMTGSHVGHDCRVGNGVVMANHASLGGHCEISDNVIIGGLSGVHQFVRIGKGAIIGAVTMVRRDVIPYGLVQGPAGELEGLNLVGLRRRNADGSEIRKLRSAFDHLSGGGKPFSDLVIELQGSGGLVGDIVEFVNGQTDRSYLVPRKRSGAEDVS